MNKYKKQSKAAQRMRKKRRMCLDKVPFSTKEEAFQKGQECYKCPHCGLWHRSGQLASLAAQVRRKVDTPATISKTPAAGQ